MRVAFCLIHGIALAALLVFDAVEATPLQDPPETTTDVPASPPTLAGSWTIYYEDALLGMVSGEAHSTADGSTVDVFLDHAELPTRYQLRSTHVQWDGNRVTIQLQGRSPSAARTTVPPLAGLPQLRIVEGVTNIEAEAGDFAAELPVQSRGMIDFDRVILEMEVQEDGSLKGEWSYRADPVTERDRSGFGRIGRFTHSEVQGALVGEQRGREVWLRSEAKIISVVVTDRQLDRDVAGEHSFRFGERDSQRHLVVFGRNLPRDADQVRELVSLQADVIPEYEIRTFSSELVRPHIDRDLFDRALATLQQSAGAEGSRIRYNTRQGPPESDDDGVELDAVLLRVRIPTGTPPQRYEFRLNGARGSWPLQYGDASGRIEFIHHQDEEQSYSTDRLFAPEYFRVRIDLEAALPQETLSVLFGRNGEVASVRRSDAGPDEKPLVEVLARRTTDDATVYLTDPILVARSENDAASKDLYIVVSDGDTVRATAPESASVALVPSQAEAQVYFSPQEIDSLWKQGLKTSANCLGYEVQDWDTIAFETAKTEWNLVLTNMGYHTSPILQFVRVRGDQDVLKTKEIQVGDHAAMLLLRDGFVEMMEQAMADWAKITSPATRDAFLKQVRASLDRRVDVPLGYTRILDPDGDEVPLKDFFPASIPMREYDLTEFEAAALQDRALNRALLEYRKGMRDATWKAKGIDDCDIPALLDLTGYGFKAVAEYVIPRLMKMEDTGNPPRQRWVPDRVARARVASLYVLGDAIRAQRDEADLDTAVVMSLAALATMPLNAVRAAWAAYTVLAVDAADVAYVLFHELPEYVRRQEDVEFSIGASAATGTDRIREAEGREQKAWELLLSGAGAGLGAAGSSVDAIRALRGVREVPVRELRNAGAELVRRLDQSGLDEINNFTRDELRTLSSYLAETRETVRRAGVDALTEDQRLALRNRERLLDHLANRGEVLAEAEIAARALDRLHPPDPRPRIPTSTDELVETSRSLAGRIERATSQLEEMKENPRLNPTEDMLPEEVARMDLQRNAAVRRTEEHIGDLRARAAILDDLVEESRQAGGAAAIKADDLDWLTGRRVRLNESDYLEARRTIFGENGRDWKRVTNLADGTPADRLRLHKATNYRREQVNQLLDETMRNVAAEEGVSGLRRNSFGSNNPKSDYDLSIEGPGAELVVKRFNDEFRRRFGAESGTVFDTNVYTDPVYRMFRADAEVVGPGGMTYAQFDDLRQFMYDQMATAKYMTRDQWRQHRAMIEGAAPEEMRPALGRVLDEVEYFQSSAHQRFLSRFGGTREARTPDLELRVTNQLYGETLEQIHALRKIADHLSNARRGQSISMDALPPWMHGTEFALKFDLVSDLLRSGDPEVVRYGEQILDELQARVANQLRVKQGHALYYASEAYQTEGTIAHVVGEIQSGGEAVTAARLLTPPLQHPRLPPAGLYLNSFAENRANMFKELNAMHAFDDSGRLAAGFEKAEKAAIKAAKYFVRQLDAAHRAGIDLREVLADDLKLIAQTVELDKTRASGEAFAELLRRMETTPEDFVNRALAASEALARRAMQNSPLNEFPDALARFYRMGDDHMASVSRTASTNPGRLGPPDPPPPPRTFSAIEEEEILVELRRLEEEMEARRVARYADPNLTVPEPPRTDLPDEVVRTGDETLDPAIATADETIDQIAEGTVDLAHASDLENTTDIILRMRRNNGISEDVIAPPPVDLPPAPRPNAGPRPVPPDFPGLPKDGVYQAGRVNEFEVGEYVGKGKYAVVYAMEGAPGDPPHVIKILAGEAIQNGEDPFIVAREMEDAQRLLREAGIEHLESRFFTRDVDRPHMLQRDIRNSPDHQMFSSKQASDPAIFTRDHQEAVVKLFRKLADRGLIWEDAKIDNIYFIVKEDGEIVAGILDTDRIVPFGKRDMRWGEIREAIEIAPAYVKFKIRSLADSNRPPDLGDDPTKAIFPDEFFFMEKMFEYGERWIVYNPYTRQFTRTKIDPDLIAKHFPEFREGRNVNFDFAIGAPAADRPRVHWAQPEDARPDPLFDPLGETNIEAPPGGEPRPVAGRNQRGWPAHDFVHRLLIPWNAGLRRAA